MGGAVANHFDLLLGVSPDMPTTFQEAAPLFRSAVVAEADMGVFDGALFERVLADGLGERPMIRRGSLGLTVTREVVESWGVSPGEVWVQARSGSLWAELCEITHFSSPEGVPYHAIRGGRWTSTHVLGLERHLSKPVANGALVAVPVRDEVLFHQIEDEEFVDVTLAMVAHAVDSYLSDPLPVPCDLFWWDAGQLHRIATPRRGPVPVHPCEGVCGDDDAPRVEGGVNKLPGTGPPLGADRSGHHVVPDEEPLSEA